MHEHRDHEREDRIGPGEARSRECQAGEYPQRDEDIGSGVERVGELADLDRAHVLVQPVRDRRADRVLGDVAAGPPVVAGRRIAGQGTTPALHDVGGLPGAQHHLADPAKQEPIVQKMIELEPNDPENYWKLAKIYEDAGAYAEAEEQYWAAEAVQPVYRQIQRADLDRQTPCADWDLHQLLPRRFAATQRRHGPRLHRER